jgi:hypothetical protein
MIQKSILKHHFVKIAYLIRMAKTNGRMPWLFYRLIVVIKPRFKQIHIPSNALYARIEE